MSLGLASIITSTCRVRTHLQLGLITTPHGGPSRGSLSHKDDIILEKAVRRSIHVCATNPHKWFVDMTRQTKKSLRSHWVEIIQSVYLVIKNKLKQTGSDGDSVDR